jgi:hypothetical protein
MIAVKREVAAGSCRFSVERMSSYKTGDKSLYKGLTSTAGWKHRVKRGRYTRESVQSPLVVLNKVRIGGDFFYGKSGNAYHTEGI